MSSVKVRRTLLKYPAAACLIFILSAAAPTSRFTDRAQQPISGADENSSTLAGRQEALRQLQQAVRHYLEIGATDDAARTLARVGRLQLILNAPSDALASHEQALELLKRSADTEARVDNLNGKAAVHVLLQQHKEAVQELSEAQALSESTGYLAGQAQALLTLSDSQNYNENHLLALNNAQQALKLWQALDDKAGLARTYAKIGQYYMALWNLPESENNYQQSLELYRDLNDPAGQAGCLINLGFVAHRKGDWAGEIGSYTRAQGLLDPAAEAEKMGQISAGLAEAFSASGLPEVGLGHYQEALEFYRRTQDPHLIRYATWGLGCTYFQMEQFSEALQYLQQSLTDADKLEAAPSYEFIGRVQLAQKDYVEAQTSLQKAFDIYQRAANPMEAARVRALIGQIYFQQGQFDRARQSYQQSLESFQQLSDRLDLAAINYAFGRLEMKTGNYDAAQNYLQQSIDLTDQIRQSSSNSDLATAFSATVHERYQARVECLMRQASLSAAGSQPPPSASGSNSQLSRADNQFTTRAFEGSEMARARTLVDILRANGVSPLAQVDRTLADRERSLEQALRARSSYKITLLSGKYKQEDIEALDAELSRLESEYKQLRETIRQRYPAYAEITQPGNISLSQLQQRIFRDDQTVLLEYMLGEDHSYLWTVTRTELHSFELPGRAQIEQQAQKFYELLTARQPKKNETAEQRRARIQEGDAHVADAAAALSEMILRPAMDQLRHQRLIIAADGALQRVPFEVLPAPNQANPDRAPLVIDHEIVYEPSASALAWVLNNTAQRAPARNSVAVFANPVFERDDPRVAAAPNANKPSQSEASAVSAASRPADGTGASTTSDQAKTIELQQAFRDVGLDDRYIAPLPASRDEADAIMSEVPWFTGFQALNFDASRATIMRPEMGQYRIVHLATHGLVDERNPELSGLVLSLVDRQGNPQQGYLRLGDVYNLNLPVDLVVLSACSSGLGKEVKGEGLIGLTRGFMYAGAASVTASLWKVDDEATAELMKRFYAGMFKDGLTPAAALRQAQIAMWQGQRWHQPYYWAAFVIQGQYDQKVNTDFGWGRRLKLGAAPVGLALLLLLAAFILRKRRRGGLL